MAKDSWIFHVRCLVSKGNGCGRVHGGWWMFAEVRGGFGGVEAEYLAGDSCMLGDLFTFARYK